MKKKRATIEDTLKETLLVSMNQQRLQDTVINHVSTKRARIYRAWERKRRVDRLF